MAASVHRNEPEHSIINTVSAGCQYAVILMQYSTVFFESLYHTVTLIGKHCNCTAVVTNYGVIVVKAGSILIVRIDRFASGAPCSPVWCMCMTHRQDIRVSFMDGGVHNKSGPIDRMLTFHDLAFVIGQDQVGHFNL